MNPHRHVDRQDRASGNKRIAILLAAALIAALLGIAGTATTSAQTESVTFSGTITAHGSESVADVVVTVVARCWWQCSSEAEELPTDVSERARPLDSVAFLGETGVDSSGNWSITVSGFENQGDPLLVVWDGNAELATRFISGFTHQELWRWESLSDIDIDLEAGGRVSGRFTNSDGGALPPGSYALGLHDQWPGYYLALDVDPETGEFTSPAGPAGEYRLAYGNLDGDYLGNNDAARVEVTAGQTASVGSVTLLLLQSGEMSGNVTDSAGLAISGISIFGQVSSQNSFRSAPASPFTITGTIRFWATTNEDGTYTAERIVPGSDWQVRFRDSTGKYPTQYFMGASTAENATEVTVESGGTTTDIDAQLIAGGEVVPLEDISIRDQLIANQESLLNTYRCLFDVDTEAVPDGCIDGNPARGPILAGTFENTPTYADVVVRDQLIINQESLLNTYRCLFNVDTQIVPGGCPDQTGTDDTT